MHKFRVKSWWIILVVLPLFSASVRAQPGIWQPDIMNFPHFIYLYNNAQDNTERKGVVRQFHRMIDRTGAPITEGEKCYFIYRGNVESQISVVGFFNNWDPEEGRLSRLGTTDIYFREYTFPVDARLDYKFVKDGEWILDPDNLMTVEGGYGLNSEMRMPKYEPSQWAERNQANPRGRIETQFWESTLLPGERAIHVYLPPGFDDTREYPVLFTQDGGDYLEYGNINMIADNLIAAGKIQPIIIVMVEPVDRKKEYTINTKYLGMMVNEIVPMMRNEYPLTDNRMEVGIIGDSFGGTAAFHLGLQRPDIFGLIAGQSGHYAYDNQWVIETASRINAAEHPRQSVCIQVGKYERQMGEYDFVQSAQALRNALEDKNFRVKYIEEPEDHSWAYWRRGLAEILMAFYGTNG